MQVPKPDKICTSLTASDTTVTASDADTQLSHSPLPAIIQSGQTMGGSCRNNFTEISTAEKGQYHCFIVEADHLHVVILAVQLLVGLLPLANNRPGLICLPLQMLTLLLCSSLCSRKRLLGRRGPRLQSMVCQPSIEFTCSLHGLMGPKTSCLGCRISVAKSARHGATQQSLCKHEPPRLPAADRRAGHAAA